MKSALQTLPRRGCTWSERVQPRSVYKHDKSTSLCATDMSVKPAGVMACINLVPAFSLCFVFVYVSYVLFGGLGFYIPVIWFFFTFTGDLKCCELNVCVCKYMDEWVCVCMRICTLCISQCMFYTYTLTLETSCLHVVCFSEMRHWLTFIHVQSIHNL